ncbi:MAG: manganese efflux pump MntP [Candidatus Aminicenantia bacterium]
MPKFLRFSSECYNLFSLNFEKMNIFTTLLVAISLSMDCFAVSVAGGIASREEKKFHLKLSLSFGLFQSLMALIGWYLGASAVAMIQRYDHLIAFFLLFLIGARMIYESFEKERKSKIIQDKFSNVFLLAISTSIDSLGVGLGIGFLKFGIIFPSLMFGVVSFSVSMVGFSIGGAIGKILKRWAEIGGGTILILLGIKILISHS